MCGMRKLRTLDIVDYVKAKKRCTLAHLMQKFKVSSATIHRDVAELVAAGHLERVRGGVAFFPRTEAAPTAFGTFHDRASVNREAKERIAARALEYVTEGDILFLDSSSTTAALASAIAARAFTNITLVTNSVAIMENFHKMPRNYVLIALGGNYDPQLNSFLGSSALSRASAWTTGPSPRTTNTRRSSSRASSSWRPSATCSRTARSSGAPGSTASPRAASSTRSSLSGVALEVHHASHGHGLVTRREV